MSARRYGLLLVLTLLLLAACGGKSTPAVVRTPTSGALTADLTPSPVPTATPTATHPPATSAPSATATPTSTRPPTSTPPPTTTATPTATLSPQGELAAGRRLQSIGDYAAARREFAAFLAGMPTPAATALRQAQGPGGEPVEPQGQAEARYRLAQCYLRDDAPAEAAAVLAQLLATAPDTDPYRTPAYFLLGEALSAVGRWADAEASYREFLPLAPELSSLIWQRIGTVRKATGDLPGATEAYTTALRDTPDWTNTVTIRRALADLALAQNDAGKAVAQYDLLRGGATKGVWAAEMQWLAGSALEQADDHAGAWQRWQAAIDADPTSRFAHAALVALLDAGALVDEFQRGLVDYHNGIYQLAIEAFDRYRIDDPTGKNGEAWYYTGLCFLALGQTNRGLVELGDLIVAYPDSPHWADAWLAKASAQAKAGHTTAAIATYREFARQQPDAPQAPKALWRAANLQERDGALAPAAEAYLSLARRYPRSDEGWRAYQAAGLSYFRLGNWRKAGAAWSEMLEADLPDWTRPVAYYWLGRVQAAAGETEAAKHSWQAAWESGPASFYGLRAADWLGGAANQQTARPEVPGVDKSANSVPQSSSGRQEIGELTAWLQGWAGTGTLGLPPALVADPDWQRGKMLLTLGLRSAALTAWGRVQKRYADDPWTLADLALAFRDAGEYRLSIVSAERLATLWPGGDMSQAPLALQRLAYPLPYADLIREQADRWKLDPRLLAAVIRQESRFEPAAASHAGAQGLMQVMPGTAQGIAAQLGWHDFRPEQIYRPYVNVAFGAYYIHQGLEQFDGSLAAALAAYNGGPGNAAFWRKLAPGDDDLMVALISVGETRVYVQTVWAQYDVYRRLYP